ncbi:MAG: hypothetical protein AB1918_16215, partial [Pseudomonadota bacterium]
MIRFAAVLFAAAFAAGCAGPPEAPPPAAAIPTKAPGGHWRVTQAQAAAPMPTSESPYLGQVLALDDTGAGAPSGRFCDNPAYAGRTAVAADILGTTVRPAEARDAEPRPVTQVTCGDEDFGHYLHLADGTLLTRVNDWVLRLEPTPKPEPAPAAAAAAPTSPPPPAAQAPAPRRLVYLASYRTEKAALAGWAALAKASPVLRSQEPVTR